MKRRWRLRSSTVGNRKVDSEIEQKGFDRSVSSGDSTFVSHSLPSISRQLVFSPLAMVVVGS